MKEYYKKIQSGEIAACEEIRSVYKRMVEEMDREKDGSFPFWFSEETGQYVIDFIEGPLNFDRVIYFG